MARKRRSFSAQFKFKVALEAVREIKTLNELASEHETHPNQITRWKRQLLKDGAETFSQNADREKEKAHAAETDLFEQIGRLKMELEWLKKSPGKHKLIDRTHPSISIRRQCELLGVNRSMLYRRCIPQGGPLIN